MIDRLRIVTIAGIAAWFAITVFYGAVVVPAAHDVMGNHRDIGFVTRKVTGPLNVLGLAVTGLAIIEHLLAWKRRARRMRTGLSVTLGIILAAQASLVALRAILEGHLDVEAMTVTDSERFGFFHERYLNLTTVLMLAGAVHAGLLLCAGDTVGRAPEPR